MSNTPLEEIYEYLCEVGFTKKQARLLAVLSFYCNFKVGADMNSIRYVMEKIREDNTVEIRC